MAHAAPETPTTQQLHDLYPLDDIARLRIDMARDRASGILSGEQDGTMGVLGPCALTEDSMIIRSEGAINMAVTENEEGLVIAHRLPFWKPRTNAGDWHGLETGYPDGRPDVTGEAAHSAYRTIAVEAMLGAGVAAELGQPYHIQRYGHMMTLGWFGGRNIANGTLMDEAALYDTTLPLAVKNGLDGTIRPALEHIDRLTDLRGEGAAPVVLLYRGGENAKDPQSWEREYRGAIEATAGRMIADSAHGTEMAHYQGGGFKKSVEGQEVALQHMVQIAERTGETPAAIMAEASAAASPTDPVIQHRLAIRALRRIHAVRQNQPTRVSVR